MKRNRLTKEEIIELGWWYDKVRASGYRFVFGGPYNEPVTFAVYELHCPRASINTSSIYICKYSYPQDENSYIYSTIIFQGIVETKKDLFRLMKQLEII